MIDSLLFVHGTGVRQAAYAQSLNLIRSAMARQAPTISVQGCLWGEVHGAKLHLGGVSIPRVRDGPAGHHDEEAQKALWDLLLRDPFFELRQSSTASTHGFETPGRHLEKLELRRRLADLADAPELLERPQAPALASHWREAVSTLAGSGELALALDAAAEADPELRAVLARAAVASMQASLASNNLPLMGWRSRDDWVRECTTLLGGSTLGLGQWVKGRVLGLAGWWLTKEARRDRDALFNAVYPCPGDILRYQAHGTEVRRYIAKSIAACEGDVAILAHSLGGIACVDLLIEQHLPQVKLLATVGSQAPFLYEIGALASLRVHEPLPAYFPRWLNFFDQDDLLSYAAAPVFPGRADDIELRSAQHFPASHSAYWDDVVLWDSLAPHLR